MGKEKKEPTGTSRRQFLRVAGITAGTAALGAAVPLMGHGKEEAEAPEYAEYPKSKYRLKFINRNCMECGVCAGVCSMRGFGESNPRLAALRLTLDYFNADVDLQYCRQCDAPGCVPACKYGAAGIDKTTGARIIDREKCVGCGECVKACPFGVVAFNEKLQVSYKCDLCGGDPLCVKYCQGLALELTDLTEGGV